MSHDLPVPTYYMEGGKFFRELLYNGQPSLCLVIPIEGSDKRRFFAVLHMPPITSPVEAVQAAIVAERRA